MDTVLTEKERREVIRSVPFPVGSHWVNDVARAIEVAVLAKLREQELGAWQPIETAPKGIPILLRSKRGRVADGLWIIANSNCGGWAWAYVNIEPTHWMPLPAAPEAPKEKP